MPRLAMTVAGFLFLLIALMHLAHIFYDLEFKVAGYVVPLWLNVAGTVAFALLALLMFWSVQIFSRRRI